MVRFIGSKEYLLRFIEDAWRRYIGAGGYCVGDLFCGTAAVSRLFKKLGNRVVANDNLRLGYTFGQAALNISGEPTFDRLLKDGQVQEGAPGTLCFAPYDAVLSHLNSLSGEDGFFFEEYSPGGTRNKEFERCYFSDENARKIDAIRSRVADWVRNGLLSEAERCLLLSDLMRAANRVANIAGTYGCFIRRWDARAHKPLLLKRAAITPSPHSHEVFCMDANALARMRRFDILYLDPPYTWRHYGAYYHILETIAQEDKPHVSGRTGLRPWEQSKSRYCDRSDAVNALRDIIFAARTQHLFLSYSDEGLIAHDDILRVLAERGKPACLEFGYRRYRSNDGGTGRKTLKERLYYVKVGSEPYGHTAEPDAVLAEDAEQRSA
jgi:adenine-specific DNA-methyltransferase